jgi:hypothetical protein
MPITADATTQKFLNERIRPLAEAARVFYAFGVDTGVAVPSSLAQLFSSGEITVDSETGALVATNPDNVIEDGRANQGVTPMTTGDLVIILNTLSGVVSSIGMSAEIQTSLVKASVRPINSPGGLG